VLFAFGLVGSDVVGYVVDMKFKDNKQWKWWGEKHIASQTVRLFQLAEGLNGEVFRREFTEASEIPYKNGAPIENPTLTLEYDEARNIMHELWELGFRPAGVESSNEYVQSLKDHIKTLQSTNMHFMELQKGDFVDSLNLIEKAAKAIKNSADS